MFICCSSGFLPVLVGILLSVLGNFRSLLLGFYGFSFWLFPGGFSIFQFSRFELFPLYCILVRYAVSVATSYVYPRFQGALVIVLECYILLYVIEIALSPLRFVVRTWGVFSRCVFEPSCDIPSKSKSDTHRFRFLDFLSVRGDWLRFMRC